MKQAILSALISLPASINKSDVELELQNTVGEGKKIMGFYETATTLTETSGFSYSVNTFLVKDFYRQLNRSDVHASLSSHSKFFVDMVTLLKNTIDNSALVMNGLRDLKSSIIATNAIAAANANLLLAVPHYYFMYDYSLRLLNFILAHETALSNRSSADEVHPNEEAFLKDNMRIFINMISVYGSDNKYFSKRLMGLSDTILNRDDNDRVDEFHSNGSFVLVDGMPNGFVGNPIYHIGSAYIRWQADRYKNFQEKERLMQLRLNYYRASVHDQQPDAKTEREIQYLENKITSLNAKMRRIEGDIYD